MTFTTRVSIRHRKLAIALAASLIVTTPAGAAPPPPGYVSALATAQQNEVEHKVLQILADPRVHAARKKARKLLEASPLAKLPGAAERIDHTLDAWVTSLAFQQASADPDRPVIVWNTNTSAYTWFGHSMPVAALSGDNPDNVYRHAPIDGSARYVIHGKLQPMNPAQFMFELVRHADITPTGKDNVVMSVVSSRDLDIAADGTFTITIDSDPANGRPNHLQSQPGPLLRLIMRDTLSNWRQSPNDLAITRVDGPPVAPAPSEAVLAGQVADQLNGWVSGWLRFVEQLNKSQPQNVLAPPYPRNGGWGYLDMMRYHLADDEALVVKIDDGGAEYAALQVTDPWTIAADPAKFVTSYTSRQMRPDADGTYTYVIAPHDPGTANWIDTAGGHQGWVILRWQGLPHTRTSNDGLLRDFRLVKTRDLTASLPAGAQGVTPEQREHDRQERTDAWRLRVATGP